MVDSSGCNAKATPAPGSVGTGCPAAASTSQPPSWRLNTDAAVKSNTARIWANTPASGSASPTSVAVVRANASASARARNASVDRRALRSTSTLTVADTATNTTSDTRFCGSDTVNVRTGSTKYQLVMRKAATAATTPTAVPPSAAMATTNARASNSTVDNDTRSPARRPMAVRTGIDTTPINAAPARRRLLILD